MQFYVTRDNIREANTRLGIIVKTTGSEMIDAYIFSDREGYLNDDYSCDGLHLTGASYLALKEEIDKF